MIALQNFAVFCQTSKWISHRYTSVSSFLKLLPISLPIPHSRLSIFHGTSQSIYTKSNGLNENFAALSTFISLHLILAKRPRSDTFISQYHILSPLQNRYFGLRVETSNFPDLYDNMAAHDSASPKLQHTGNSCFPGPRIPDPLLQGQLINHLHYLKIILIQLIYQTSVRLCRIMKIRINVGRYQQIPTILLFEESSYMFIFIVSISILK